MEERLRAVAPRPPRPSLRSRVIEAARREAHLTVWDRIWASRLFWCAASAAIAAAFLLTTPPTGRALHEKTIHIPPAAPSQLAQSLAGMLGDGPRIERWLAFRLENPGGAHPRRVQTLPTILEELECQG